MRWLLLTLANLPLVALAADSDGAATKASSMFSGAYLIQVFLSLIVVVGLMFAVLWALRKVNGVGRSVGGHMQVLASVGLGQRERAVLVQVGGQQLLLGVAPGSVRTLHVFDQPVVDATATAAGGSINFGDVWKHAMGQRGQDA